MASGKDKMTEHKSIEEYNRVSLYCTRCGSTTRIYAPDDCGASCASCGGKDFRQAVPEPRLNSRNLLERFVNSLFPFEDEDGQIITGKEDGDYIFAKALFEKLDEFIESELNNGTK